MAEESIAAIGKIVGPINHGKPVYGKHVILVFNEGGATIILLHFSFLPGRGTQP